MKHLGFPVAAGTAMRLKATVQRQAAHGNFSLFTKGLRTLGAATPHATTSRCACSARLSIPRYPASVQARSSSPCRSRSVCFRCISGSRTLFLFLVDDGAEMMVASTMPPSFSSTPARPGDPRSAERQVRQSAALQPAAEIGTVVSSDTFSRLVPARRRTLSASQAGPPSPDRSGCIMAERSARAASPATDAAAAPCGHPLDASAQCGSSAPERSRGASWASCNRIRGWRRSIAEGAACRDPPKERRGAKWQARPQCTMPCPKSGCIQRFPS